MVLGNCPNCGLNWSKVKTYNVLWYAECVGVMLCWDCYPVIGKVYTAFEDYDGSKLNLDRILSSLRELGWPEDKLDLVSIAVQKAINAN